jgi:prephenate dehydrogenase
MNKKVPVAAVIGVGLMGGSLALQWRAHQLADWIIGVEANDFHAQQAVSLQLVNEIRPLDEALDKADVIALAIPMDAMLNLLPSIMDKLQPHQIVFDLGSTKALLLRAIDQHPHRKQFVSTHPMWGTEHNGPAAATIHSFQQKAVVICNAAESNTAAVDWVRSMYLSMGMHVLDMQAEAHDLHAAYISHISHITSFALANTVLEKEKEEDTIFELASGGFESTVRLAKSSPAMWVPIFQQNRENVLDVLNEHISQLRKFKSCLEKENYAYLATLIEQSNTIRKVLNPKPDTQDQR